MNPAIDEKAIGEQATGEQATGEQATGEQAIGEQAIGEQASGEQATGEQTTGEQATGEQAIVEFNGRHSKLSCFQPLVSPPACPSAAAAAAETLLFLGNEHMTTAAQCKPFPAERNTALHCNANLFLPSEVGRRLSRTYACGTPWLTLGNSTGAWRA